MFVVKDMKWTKEYTKEYYRSKYNRLKLEGICTECRKEKATDEHVSCLICIEKSNKRHRENWKKVKKEDPEKYHRIYGASRYQRNKEKLLAYYLKRNHEMKQQVIEHYGNKCACCGEETGVFLTIDHINGKGAEERRKINSKGGTSFYRYLVKNNFPDGYQVLCWNCNLAKHILGECPHNRKDGDIYDKRATT